MASFGHLDLYQLMNIKFETEDHHCYNNMKSTEVQTSAVFMTLCRTCPTGLYTEGRRTLGLKSGVGPLWL